jgi:hypothetical protein
LTARGLPFFEPFFEPFIESWPDSTHLEVVFMYVPLNLCSICGVDFTSLRAFDSHLGGTPQNRVHLSPEEAGLELRETVQGVARYGLVLSKQEQTRLAGLRR